MRRVASGWLIAVAMKPWRVIAWWLVIGLLTPAAVAQSDRPIVFSRVCNIQPGQDAAAKALAEEMVAVVNERYPGAKMTVDTGRWMTGFQSIDRPVNQIRFTEQHADLETRDAFTMLLLGDDDVDASQRKVAEAIDFGSCTETQFRTRPSEH